MSRDKAAIRARAKEMREQQARQERRREQLLRFGIGAAVLAAVVVIGIAIQAGRSGDGGGNGDSGDLVAVESSVDVPAARDDGGTGITLGDESAPVTVDIWVDFSCPHCKDFEAANGETIDELAGSGDAAFVYHPASFMTTESVTAANAFACSVDAGRASSFLRTAYANQDNYSDDDLVAMGEAVGITDAAFAGCVRDNTYGDWVSGVQDGMGEAGVEATPTIFVNGELREDLTAATPDDLRAAVEEAAA